VAAAHNGSTNGTSLYYNGGNVGIGTITPGVALDVSQDKAIRVGNAILSSGGDYVHLGNYSWLGANTWQFDGPAPSASSPPPTSSRQSIP